MVIGLGLLSSCRVDRQRSTTVVPTTSTPPTTATIGSTSSTVTTRTSATSSTVSRAPVAAAGSFQVLEIEGVSTDPARGRLVRYKLFAPAGVPGATPVVLVSHGGNGSPGGHLTSSHIGSTLASGGFLAIHVGHDVSTGGRRQLDDRPADVAFLLDELAAGRIELPDGYIGTADLTRVGHTGHSFGAYTSHAVAGATYARTYRDERIDAIAPISPQGPDQFGAFVRGPGDTTWTTVEIPSFNLIGGDELDSNAIDSIVRPGWRLAPYDNYPGTSDTFRTIIAGQDHSDMWRTGSTEVKTFIATEILDFMRLYVAGDTSVDACTIGVGQLSIAESVRRAGRINSALTSCS